MNTPSARGEPPSGLQNAGAFQARQITFSLVVAGMGFLLSTTLLVMSMIGLASL
jgi:hypothetical protein